LGEQNYVLDRFSNRSMKRFAYLLIGMPFLGMLLTSCGKYQSSIEANGACEEWAMEGGEIVIHGWNVGKNVNNPRVYLSTPENLLAVLDRTIEEDEIMERSQRYRLRFCEEDTKTRQYLGYRLYGEKGKELKKGDVFIYECEQAAYDCPPANSTLISDMWGRGEVSKRFYY